MKTLLALSLVLMIWMGMFSGSRAGAQEGAVKVKMTFNNQEVIIEMFDSPASKDFLSLLPFSGNFEDFAGAEKISYLPRKLATRGTPTARQIRGDFTYYSPWGNLAVFYKGAGSDGSLYVLGRIVEGKDKLAGMNQSFTATIKRIK